MIVLCHVIKKRKKRRRICVSFFHALSENKMSKHPELIQKEKNVSYVLK